MAGLERELQAPRILADVEAHSDEWHAARALGNGSSDAAAEAGLDPFCSPFAKWVEKTTGTQRRDTPALIFGRRLEAVVADHFADEHPEFALVHEPGRIYQHASIDWMLASPDRLLFERLEYELPTGEQVLRPGGLAGLLEIKTSRSDRAWEDGPPDYVVVQVQHQLAVTGLQWAIVAVLLHGRDYREHRIDRDDALIGHLITIEGRFWQHVIDRTPPPVDASDSTLEALRGLYVPELERSIELDAIGRALFSQWLARRTLVDDAERARDELAAELMLLMGEATVATIDGEPAITWKPITSKRVDTKALRAAHPGIAAEFTNETTTRRFELARKRQHRT